MSEQLTINAINGVNVDAVHELIDEIEKDPDLAKSKFRIRNRWVNGSHNRSTVTGFYGAKQEIAHLKTFELDADAPLILAGEDQSADPVEHLLHALAACLTSTLVYHAALRGIEIEELESELEGDIDVRGFLGITDTVRKGYQNIRVTFKVRTDAENLERLRAFTKLSPVLDVTANGTNVDVRIERK